MNQFVFAFQREVWPLRESLDDADTSPQTSWPELDERM